MSLAPCTADSRPRAISLALQMRGLSQPVVASGSEHH